MDLVHVFGERCQTIGRALCLSTEELFEEAIILAKLRDQERAEARNNGTVDQLPVMHGVPMSVKDVFAQKGHLTTVGVAYLCDDYATEDCVAVKLYLKAGAIPLVRGNVPQSALSLDCENKIWGHAKNPRD